MSKSDVIKIVCCDCESADVMAIFMEMVDGKVMETMGLCFPCIEKRAIASAPDLIREIIFSDQWKLNDN